ncbi:DUF488 domain-containing protein [Chitinophaga pinensis]|uniref:DUF488 domain-containing protein n=1 Tax=Chitinophaga pinensis (strain ATCC 43595 / DSM 2588 / LMG 13176 / NBRC 15968 / NCIMB 11800 / UQM 2034) TaxID=485918 RepID=A0A979G041_CHIPD|nr:DUF488 domain-containing protein [Chitinophaga pinensis]ACU58271.1 protein of unknown function DUF1130 [Chitinophaga pinensis DSM 2588]
MFYRRKIILALLELFEDELEKIRLQKLLFLFCQKQEKADYDFIPYKYGCYSYSANADMTTMVTKGLLAETATSFKKTDNVSYLKLLKPHDLSKLKSIKTLYGEMDSTALMKHTYRNFPYWAINSIKAPSILSKEELDKVEKHKASSNQTILYTIGYEGGSLEDYLNRLLRNDVKVLIDVRNNPLSMKFGFSKSLLKRYCESLDIIYMHFPEVGIVSDKRQALNTQADYDRLFADYCENDIPKTIDIQLDILNILRKYKRIALTCFEANYCQCHRSHLANAIKTLPGFEYEVKHI